MKVAYHLWDRPVTGLAQKDSSILLTNKRGGFLYLGCDAKNTSRYQGAFFPVVENSVGPADAVTSGKNTPPTWTLYKTIHAIRPRTAVLDETHVHPELVERRGSNIVERFSMNHSNVILYEADNYNGLIDLVFDCRMIEDYHDMGRIYSIDKRDGLLLLSYDKYDGPELDRKSYSVYCAIAGVGEYAKNGLWEREGYPFDSKRGSRPSDGFVYNALSIRVDRNIRIALGFSTNADDAVKTARQGLLNWDYIQKAQKSYCNTISRKELVIPDEQVNAAYHASLKALDSMLTDIGGFEGILAGLPWFAQFYSRDEAISAGALVAEARFEDAKKLLCRLAGSVEPDGRIPNRIPHAGLGSADSVGWTFSRLYMLLKELDANRELGTVVSHTELAQLKSALRDSIKGLLESHSDHGLIKNSALETWMDTCFRGDERPGARIEIQAMMLSQYELMRWFTLLTRNNRKYDVYSDMEEATRLVVRKAFWKRPVLSDGLGDPTVRPNIFLAYYHYPGLLRNAEWRQCFDHALKRLWLPWGGVSTIDRSHELFLDEYTGEDNKSYHRGDSWYWLNNLVALCLHRLDRTRYRKHIGQILAASTREILFQGVLGYHAELSSASALKSEGCLAQSWSSALYIELVDELFGK